MALDLKPGDMQRVVKLTKLRRLNGGKGFTYDYVKQCLGDWDERTNADITSIAEIVIAERKRSEVALAKMVRKLIVRR